MSKFKVVGLFSGCGGLDLGFIQSGFEVIWANDFERDAVRTYKRNIGNHIIQGDITKISVSDIPKFDMLLAGFPCQPFSNAGLKKGFDDTRGTLFFYIAEIIKFHMPQVVFLENVKGLKNHDKGNTYRTIEHSLEKMGYSVYSKVLNAKDFGVPQNRERIYIVAFLDNIGFQFPDPPRNHVQVGDILEAIVDKKYTISDKLWAGHQRRKKEHAVKILSGFFDANELLPIENQIYLAQKIKIKRSLFTLIKQRFTIFKESVWK